MRFLILGPLEVWDGERPVKIRGPQQRAVLALLLVWAGQVVSTERIVDQLWGERAPSAARSLVQGCVAGLRRALRTGTDGLLASQPTGYLLRPPPGATDLERFEELLEAAGRLSADGALTALNEAGELLRDALSLWRGPAFDGVTLDACRAEASRLEEGRLAAVEKRIDVDLRRGLHSTLVAELRDLVRLHPLRERFWAQLMVALYRADRQADALDTYRRVRQVFVDDLGVEPGDTLRRLHQLVLAGDEVDDVFPPVARPEHAPAPARREWPVPAQLPPTAGGFVGRKRQLQRLDELLDADAGHGSGGPAVGVICGTAGVGKTALAVRWAHRVRDGFGDGQLYVDLRGYSTAPPLQPIEALAGFLQALDVPPERIAADQGQAAALYRTLMAGRRMLVILDNARSPDQVRPLLPGGSGSVVLVTSRDKLGGLVARDGARHVTLGALPPDDAYGLLVTVLGGQRVDAEPQAAAELARMCAFLPLALRIAAANLTVNPRQSIAGHVAELADGNRLAALAVGGDAQSAVRVAFDLSYHGLDPAARTLFLRLGPAPCADFTAETAAALAGVAPPVAAALLGRLADAHLIDEHAAGRYSFHDLLRLHASELARAEEPRADRYEAINRLYRGYLDRVRAAAALLYPHMLLLPATDDARDPSPFADRAAALAWLEAERPNLLLAVTHTADRGPRRAGWLIADALRGYFHLRRYVPDWLAVADAALTAAHAEGDEQAQAAARHSLGTAYRSIGDNHEALRHYTEALRLSRRSGWREAEATTLGNLGIIDRRLGRLETAVGHLTAALAIDRQLGRRAGEANNLGLLANVYLEQGRLGEAAAHFAAGWKLNTEIGSSHGSALALTGLGEVCHGMGRLDEAIGYLDAATTNFDEVGDRDGATVVQCHLALIDCDLGRPRRGRERALAALAQAGETGDRRTEIGARNAAGIAERLLGHHLEAIEHHRHAYDLAREAGGRYLEGESLLALALAYRAHGSPDDADRFARQALTVGRQYGFRIIADRAEAQLPRAAGRRIPG